MKAVKQETCLQDERCIWIIWELGWKFRLQCRIFWSEAWDASFLSNKPMEDPPEPSSCLLFIWESLPMLTQPLGSCVSGQTSASQASSPGSTACACFCSSSLGASSPFGSQLQTPRPLTYVALRVLIGLAAGVGWTYPFRFPRNAPLPWVR